MHQRVSLSLSFQFFSNNFKIILSIDVRQLLYLSSHECCNLVETLGIVDKRLLSDLIGSWTRPVLDSRFHLPPCVSYLDGINAISYMHYSYKTYIYIYVLDKRRITYPYDAFWSRSESMSAVKRVMQVSCTRFRDENTADFAKNKGTDDFSPQTPPIVNTLFAQLVEMKRDEGTVPTCCPIVDRFVKNAVHVPIYRFTEVGVDHDAL